MKKTILIKLIIILGIACNSPTSSDNYTTMTTSNVEEVESVFIDLSTASETTADGAWQISFQMLDVAGSTFKMSNLVLNQNPGTIMVALYDNQSFDEITSVPTTFSSAPYSDKLSDLTSTQYGNENEIISYNPSTHAITINTNKVLLIYTMATHKTWKIQFIEYSNGVILFKFAEL